MGKPDQYIKMCDCPEIQSLCSYKCKVDSVNMRWWDTNGDCWFNLNNIRNIWLPRQDQLQEMVCGGWGLQTICTRIEEFSKASDGGVSITIDGSMEQLWLAFVMKEKYNKIWNGEEWLKQ